MTGKGTSTPAPGMCGVNTFRYRQSSEPTKMLVSGLTTFSCRQYLEFLEEQSKVVDHGSTGCGRENLRGPTGGLA